MRAHRHRTADGCPPDRGCDGRCRRPCPGDRRARPMIPLPPSTRVCLAYGTTDMRKGFDGLAVLVQQVLEQSPHSGALFAFRGKRGDLIKLLWFDGSGDVPVFQAHGSRQICLACDEDRQGQPHLGPAFHAARRYRLAPSRTHCSAASGRIKSRGFAWFFWCGMGPLSASRRTSRSAPKPLFLRSRTRWSSAASPRPPRLLANVAADRASADGAAQRSPRS